MAVTTTFDSAPTETRSLTLAGVLARFVGPAALTAAGMIGAGAVATRLLAGAWFGFGLLWVALYVIPLVIVSLDSAARVAMKSAGRGMLDMVRRDISATLAWTIFVGAFLVNIVVNMSQMAAMVEGAYGAMGSLPPVGGLGFFALTTVLTAGTVSLAVLGGYKRIERIMTFLLVAKLVCFIIVATKGLLDWYTWPALVRGLVPHIPPSEPVVGTTRVREGLTQLMAIAGQALPPTVFLTYGYLHSNAGYTTADAKKAFWKTVYNLGFIWGLFSVVVIVAGTTALHNVYNGNGPSFLGVSHYSQIETIPVAGQVLGPAFPGLLGFLAPRFFSLGLVGAGFTTLISVSLTMTYLCLDMFGQDWQFTRSNKRFQAVFALWIAIPALLTPFWAAPALLKAITAMVGNLLLAPLAVGVIFYFVNRPSMGELKATLGRNVLLSIALAFALGLAIIGAVRLFWMAPQLTRAAVVAAIEEAGVVAVVRLKNAGAGRDVALALADGGVTAIEITMTVPSAVRLIEQLASMLPAQVLIGAGTVLDAATANDVIAAGARFVVSPVFRPAVIEACHRHDVAAMPGCFSPTEIADAWDAGADVVKVFPATALGPGYFKDIRGPLPHIKLMPTGGVSLENAGEWIRAGACAIGAGSALVDPAAVAAGRFADIAAKARQFVDAVRMARGRSLSMEASR